MSGWINVEKDLLTDPRFVAAEMGLDERYNLFELTGLIKNPVTADDFKSSCNVTPLPSVTLLLGALVRLWIIADTHIGEDDILALNVDQIDKLIGIDGFCKILPRDWLEILSGDRVKLPNYHTHNGTTAKERSANAARQAKFRERHYSNDVSNVTASNAKALPRPRPRPRPKEEPLTPVPGVDLVVWDRWREFRTAIKKPIRDASIQASQRSLAAFAADQAAVVEQSVDRKSVV